MKSCKRKFSWFFVAATAAIFFGFAVKSAQAGDPIPGVDVSLEQQVPVFVAKATTGKDGRFNFDKLKPGKYVLRIVPSSFKVESYNSSRSNLSQSIGSGGVEIYKASIELRKDKHLKSVKYKTIPISISPKRRGRVAGQITRQFAVRSAQAGDPIPGVDVSLEQQVPVFVAKVTTGKDGRFNFDKLKPGKYVLRIVPSSFKVESYNSSRSNLSQSIGSGGVEVYKASIELRKDKHLKSVKYKTIPISISSKRGGSVAGQITRQSIAIKKKGVN